MLFSRVPVTTNLIPDSSTAMSSFKSSHPTFLEWSKITWLSLSPDLKSVVFTQDGKLYSKGLAGPSVFLRNLDAKEIRGIQWFDLNLTDAKDLAAIGLK